MRNDYRPSSNFADHPTERQAAARNRAGLAKRPEARDAMRQGYLDAMAGAPWATKWTLGDDTIQNAYAWGRHCGAIAKSRDNPPRWPASSVYPTRLQQLLADAYQPSNA